MNLNLLASISSIISIPLAIVSIVVSIRADKRSTENYRKTKELLDQINEVALSNQRDIGYVNRDLENI